MYYYSWYGYNPNKKLQLFAPRIQSAKEISIVIPVKSNQSGIDKFLSVFFETQKSNSMPTEIIIVCDKGTSINLSDEWLRYPIEIQVLHSRGSGPASARNVGWHSARGKWILFTDSDCRPTNDWLDGYTEASNGSIAYAGTVLSSGSDFVSKYYESQSILMPSANKQGSRSSPDYVVTANALIWREALEEVGGFNELIKTAAGEDIDLGFRLREIGDLSFAVGSVVFHDFDDGMVGFIKRFRRYGKGNRQLAEMYNLKIIPKPFKPMQSSFANSILAYIQYFSMLWGWYID
jgi:glycosyltransferase involved in cell wall biosynthesis